MNELVLTRVDHSCMLLDFGGDAVLTDPWFSEQRGYYRGEPLGITLNSLPRLTGVVASHAHYDHYDRKPSPPIRIRVSPSSSGTVQQSPPGRLASRT